LPDASVVDHATAASLYSGSAILRLIDAAINVLSWVFASTGVS